MSVIVSFESGVYTPERYEFAENVGTGGVTIKGNRLRVWNDDGTVAVTAELKYDFGVLVWRLRKGQRGKEIGLFREVELGA